MTTPEKRRSSSPDQTAMSDYSFQTGPIPADAFENEPGPPRKLPLTEEGLKKLDEETAALKAAAENVVRKASA